MSAKPIARFCGAKVINYFGLSKRRANKNAIYAKFCINGNMFLGLITLY